MDLTPISKFSWDEREAMRAKYFGPTYQYKPYPANPQQEINEEDDQKYIDFRNHSICMEKERKSEAAKRHSQPKTDELPSILMELIETPQKPAAQSSGSTHKQQPTKVNTNETYFGKKGIWKASSTIETDRKPTKANLPLMMDLNVESPSKAAVQHMEANRSTSVTKVNKPSSMQMVRPEGKTQDSAAQMHIPRIVKNSHGDDRSMPTPILDLKRKPTVPLRPQGQTRSYHHSKVSTDLNRVNEPSKAIAKPLSSKIAIQNKMAEALRKVQESATEKGLIMSQLKETISINKYVQKPKK